jgi:type III secretion protein C
MMYRYLIVTVLPCLFATPVLAGSPNEWKDSSYTYLAEDATLSKVLSDFSRSNGVSLRLTGTFSRHITGRLHAASTFDFLEQLAATYRFTWYVQNNLLRVSPTSDFVVERVRVSHDSMPEIKAALIGVGLFEPRFGWGELTEEGVVTVSGPSDYVHQIRELIEKSDHADEYEGMVFRLQHATVDDRTVTIRGQTVVTPGVTSLLKGLLAAAPPSNEKATTRAMIGRNGAMERTIQRLGDPVSSALQNTLGVSPSVSSGTDTGNSPSDLAVRTSSVRGGSAGGVAVQGDVRTNSIVIFDLANKRAYYQKLIDSLDEPQQLVQIEAYIVDVDRDRISELGVGAAVAGNSGFGILDATGVLKSPVVGASTFVVGNLGNFIARVNALESDGQARVLAKPSVITLENLVAVLDLSQTVYLKATGERVATIEPVTAGMLLRVTPRVTVNKAGVEVHLTVDIEDGKISDTGVGSDSASVQRSTISTQAVLHNEQSLIIGGYNADSSSRQDRGVPVLSRIPVLGALFSGSKSHEQTRQRLFILTPRLITADVARASS